ncbi:MAG: hypothetical protein H0W99_10990 [Acidobacteria bacterium]|nr:hypothetical protein [Acidobacteriota bacterium]
MFILRNREQISKAIERAKEHHTFVRVRRFGEYFVKGSAGNFYTVRCERLADGQKAVSCECVAGQFGTPCYHAAAALPLHMHMAVSH